MLVALLDLPDILIDVSEGPTVSPRNEGPNIINAILDILRGEKVCLTAIVESTSFSDTLKFLEV